MAAKWRVIASVLHQGRIRPTPLPCPGQMAPKNPGGLGATRAIVDCGQRQQSPRLRPVLAPAGSGPYQRCVEIGPDRDRHGEPPVFANLNHNLAASGNPPRVTLSEFWYKFVFPKRHWHDSMAASAG